MGTLDGNALILLAPLVALLTQATKGLFFKDEFVASRCAIFIAIVWGGLMAFAYNLLWVLNLTASQRIGWIILHGIVAALASAGLYHVGKRGTGAALSVFHSGKEDDL